MRNDERQADGTKLDSGSLLRGLALIEALQAAQRPLNATELADATQQPLSTVHRLIQVLIGSEYVYRDASKRYFAGPKALAPLHLYHPLNVLRRESREHLRAIRDQFRQTSSILVFLGMERLVLELAVENDTLSPYHATHLQSPLNGGASGKVLLAHLSQDERRKFLENEPLTKATHNTIDDLATLEAELNQVREQGFAVAINEAHLGLSAAAAPIAADGGRVIGCFVVSGLSVSFVAEKVYEAGRFLKLTAEMFSLGSATIRSIAMLVGRDADAITSSPGRNKDTKMSRT
jgi:DNA-binding IclR family transcriptional regulator